MIDATAWREIAHHRPLVALLDADNPELGCGGTPTWTCPAWLRDVAAALQRAHVQVVFASRTRREAVLELAGQLSSPWWYVEHGAWRYSTRVWAGRTPHRALDTLAAALTPIMTSRLEVARTSVSLAVSWQDDDDPAAIAMARIAVASWVEDHPGYRLVAGPSSAEARVNHMDKTGALGWIRQRLPAARCIVAGLDAVQDARDIHVHPAAARSLLFSLAELRQEVFHTPAADEPTPRGLVIRRSYRS